MADCKPKDTISKEDRKRLDQIDLMIDKWYDNPAIKELAKVNSKSPSRFFKDFYRNVTDRDFEYDPPPDLKTINKFNRKIEQLDKKMRLVPNKLKEFFYLPEVIMSKNPITKGTFNAFVAAGNKYRGNVEKFGTNLDHIVRSLDIAMKEVDGSRRWGSTAMATSKEIKRREREYQRKIEHEGRDSANEYYKTNLKNLGKEGNANLQVMENAYKLFVDPTEIRNQGVAIAKYGTALVEAANVWHGRMKGELWDVLDNGLKDYAQVIRLHKYKEWGLERTEKRISNLLEDFKKQDDYFPTQVLDIFPAITKLTESMVANKNLSGKGNFNPREAEKYMDTMIEQVSSNLARPGSTFAKDTKHTARHSKNVIDVIDTYYKNVIRFNYMARMTRKSIEGIRALQKMEGKEFDLHRSFMANYLNDVHSTATGMNSNKGAFGQLAKAATAWGFISKLGLNVRSAARNATQSIQNYVWFGRKGISDALAFIQAEDIKDLLDDAMKKEGVFFVNIEELAGSNKMFSDVIVKNGKAEFENASFMDRVNEKLTGTAQKVSQIPVIGMGKVENFNRQLTFKIAFAQEYKRLLKSDFFVREAMKVPIEDSQAAQKAMKEIRTRIAKRSQRYAANITKELHYEYSSFAKALSVGRHPVLGQFTTYGMNFLNYQVKIARGAKDSVMEGRWDSPETRRAVRLGMTYLLLNALIEPLSNTSVTNLIQHDTAERISQFNAWLRGDDEERKRAFFGKGPLIGTFGGPMISDLLNIGNLAGLIDMDEDSFLSYLGAYQDLPERAKNKEIEEYIRILNTQVHRTFFSTIPKFNNGMSLGPAAMQELALFPDERGVELREKVANSSAVRMMPDPIKDYLTPDKIKKKRRERAEAFWSSGQPKTNNSNLEELLAALTERDV